MNTEKVREIIKEFQARSSAPIGVAVKDLRTGKTVSYNGDMVFPTASTFKVYILAELFRKIAAGECSLDETIVLTEEMKSLGSGVLANLSAGISLTLKDYAVLMMIISDNTATNILFDFVGGGEAIRRSVLEPLGLNATKCDMDCSTMIDSYYEMNGRSFTQMMMDYKGVQPSYCGSAWYKCTTEQNDCTTPLEILKMFEILYDGEWVDAGTSAQMLDIMKQCQTNSRIPKYLPPYTTIAHKTGTIDRFCADAGIVYSKSGDYIVTLFYNGNLADQEDYDKDPLVEFGDHLLALLSKEIYKAMHGE